MVERSSTSGILEDRSVRTRSSGEKRRSRSGSPEIKAVEEPDVRRPVRRPPGARRRAAARPAAPRVRGDDRVADGTGATVPHRTVLAICPVSPGFLYDRSAYFRHARKVARNRP
ncbi:hypothetical protein PSD17_32160 [Pseudonocardia sp. D17]|nr:hypothetical protein PSD17_32160 [Pseudonocardia sp. D17]